MNVGRLTTLGAFALTSQRKMMVIDWTDWHRMREPLGMSSLKERAAGVVGGKPL
jgi:hypothetical protein